MNSTDWELVKNLFEQTLALNEVERDAFLRSQTINNPEVYSQVTKLLEADQKNQANITKILSSNLEEIFEEQAYLSAGDKVDQYEVVRLIGQGGMGAVFEGKRQDKGFEQRVALKVIQTNHLTKDAIARFQSERQILANLNHPNIAHLLDGGTTDDGAPYLVMEYIDGEPILDYCKKNHLSIEKRIELFLQICKAVSYAHQNLVVHRDIKPENILVNSEGQAKLLDFGIAKVLNPNAYLQDIVETQVETRIMSLENAAPEQILNQDITTRTDVYALGNLLYQLLTEETLFKIKEKTRLYLEQAICETQPIKPSSAITLTNTLLNNENYSGVNTLQKKLKGDLDNITLKALKKDPEERYRTVDQFSEDINRYLNNYPIIARAESIFYSFSRFVKRNRALVFLSALFVISIVSLSVSLSIQSIQLEREKNKALEESKVSKQTTNFLVDLFDASSPNQAKGEELTARELLDIGFDKIQDDLSEQPVVRLRLLRVLGEVFYKLGAEQRAKEILSQTLEKQIALFGEENLEVASSKILNAFIHQERGSYELAEPLYTSAFKTQKNILGNVHPTLIKTLNAIAFFEQTRGDYATSELRFREALSMVKRVDDSNSTLLAQNMKSLGGVLRIQDKNTEAEALIRDALSLQLKFYGNTANTEIDDTKRELAGLLRHSRRFEEAEKLYLEIIESRTKMLGEDHREVANAWNSYSHLLSDTGRSEEALKANKTFIDILNRAYAGPHPGLGAAYHNRALMLKDNNKLDEAIRYFELSIDMQNQVGLPENHANRAYPLAGKGRVLMLQKKFSEAKAIYYQVLSLRRGVFNENHILISETKSNLGTALTGLGEFEEAESLLLESYQLFLSSRKPDDPRIKLTVQRLINLYEQKDDSGSLEKFKLRLKDDGVSL